MNVGRALDGAAAFWLAVMLLGQWAFFYYIVAFYGVTTFSGNFEAWNRLAAIGRTPYVADDLVGNLAFAAHALAAGIVAFGGALQLFPQVRARAPVFHRWNGRVFLATVTALALSGFYLVWVRGTSPRTLDGMSTTFNGVLILAFAFLALRAVLAKRITAHRRWAMRLYLVSNAQWFLRVGVFAYFLVGGALGMKVGIGDPFIQFWTFGSYLVPLAVLELYLRAKEGGRPTARASMAAALVVITLLMGAGIVGYASFSQRLISGGPVAIG